MSNQFRENLTKAQHAAGFAEQDIRAAMEIAGPVESLILQDALRDAVAVYDRLTRLIAAVEDAE